jgi:hypothetical protein
MSSIKFNTLVISTRDGEILEVLVGTDLFLFTQLIETNYWDTMLEEAKEENLNLDGYNVQSLAHFYKKNEHNTSLDLRVSYFPDKVVFHK